MAVYLKQSDSECRSRCLEPTQLLQLLDETLPGEGRAAAYSHLDHCNICQERLAAHTLDAASRPKSSHATPASTAQVISRLQCRGMPVLDAGATTNAISGVALAAANRRDREIEINLLPGGARRFRLLGVLGEGGMSVVFRCRDARSGRDVAVKVLRHRHTIDGEIVEQFFREASIQAQLASSHVAKVLEKGTLPDDRPFLVMEYRPGQTLSQHMRRAESPASCDLQDVFRQLCAAMAYAHRHGIVHRDLKPSNILVGRRGEVTVLDWGLSDRRAADDFPAMNQAAPVSIPCFFRHVVGTPGYVAPEQCNGTAVEPTADVYSLGVILAEILIGERLPVPDRFDDERDMHQAAAGIVVAVRRSGVSAALVDLVAGCLAEDPADRISDAGQLLAAWERLAGSEEGAERKVRARSPRLLSLQNSYEQDCGTTAPVWRLQSYQTAAQKCRLTQEIGCKNAKELTFDEGRQKVDTSLRRTKRQLSECELCGTCSKSSLAPTSAPKFCSPWERRSSAAVTTAMSYLTTG